MEKYIKHPTIKENIEKLVSEIDTYIFHKSTLFNIDTMTGIDINIDELWKQTMELCSINENMNNSGKCVPEDQSAKENDNFDALWKQASEQCSIDEPLNIYSKDIFENTYPTNPFQALTEIVGYAPNKTPYQYKIDVIRDTKAYEYMNSDSFVKVDIMNRILQYTIYKTEEETREILLNMENACNQSYDNIIENVEYLKKNKKMTKFLDSISINQGSKRTEISPYMHNLIFKCLLDCKKLPWGTRGNYAAYNTYSFFDLYNTFKSLEQEEYYVFEQITGFQLAASLATILDNANSNKQPLSIITPCMKEIMQLPNIYGRIYFIKQAVRELLRLDTKATLFDIETFYLLIAKAYHSPFLNNSETDFKKPMVPADSDNNENVYIFNKNATGKNFSNFHELEQCFAALLYVLAKREAPEKPYQYMKETLKQHLEEQHLLLKEHDLLKEPSKDDSSYIGKLIYLLNDNAGTRLRSNELFSNVEEIIYKNL